MSNLDLNEIQGPILDQARFEIANEVFRVFIRDGHLFVMARNGIRMEIVPRTSNMIEIRTEECGAHSAS